MQKIKVFFVVAFVLASIAIPEKTFGLEQKEQEYVRYALKKGIKDEKKAKYLFRMQVNLLNKEKFDKVGIDLNEFAAAAGEQFPESEYFYVLRSDIVVAGNVISKTYLDDPNAHFKTIYEINVNEILYDPANYINSTDDKIYLLQKSSKDAWFSSELSDGYKIGAKYVFVCSRKPIIAAKDFIEKRLQGYENKTLPNDADEKMYFYPIYPATTPLDQGPVFFYDNGIKAPYKLYKKKVKYLDELNERRNFYKRSYDIEENSNKK